MASYPIRVQGVGKRYLVAQGQQQSNTIRDVVSQSVRGAIDRASALWGQRRAISTGPDPFWALRDIDFEVPAGQVLGIVGANGAGKSTLLKVLSRITEPTTGRAEIRGRVGSLIEVGTGFHSELTGRENIYLNGAILGMRRSEIERKFDQIVDYSGVERFIDTPIKHFSSGMLLRLGFAVAAHLETEILIVDEVLAVGDADFQRKCLSTMSRVANDGRTVLFVSHNGNAVKTLCDRAIWLKKGRITADGAPAEVLSSYLLSSAGRAPERVWSAAADAAAAVALRRVAARPEAGAPADPITTASPFVVEIDYVNRDAEMDVAASVAVFNDQETLLFETAERPAQHASQGMTLRRATCHLPPGLFAPGVYRVEVTIWHHQRCVIEEPEAVFFNVIESDNNPDVPFRRRPTLIRPSIVWDTSAAMTDADAGVP